MKLTHFLAYLMAQVMSFSGMALGFQLADTAVIEVGMAAAVVVFMSYSIAEVIAVYDLTFSNEPEDEDDDSDDRSCEWD